MGCHDLRGPQDAVAFLFKRLSHVIKGDTASHPSPGDKRHGITDMGLREHGDERHDLRQWPVGVNRGPDVKKEVVFGVQELRENKGEVRLASQIEQGKGDFQTQRFFS